MRYILHLFKIHTMEPYRAMQPYDPGTLICRYCDKIEWPEKS